MAGERTAENSSSGKVDRSLDLHCTALGFKAREPVLVLVQEVLVGTRVLFVSAPR